MRNTAPTAPSSWPTPGSSGRSLEVRLQSLTPIFKGGATPDRVDPGRPFRVPSVRGMLRYWWRATSAIGDTRSLRDREQEIFGGVFGTDDQSARASRVTLSVSRMTSRETPRPDSPAYSYVFGVTGRITNENVLHLDAKGVLRVGWTGNVGADVQRAFKAWMLFGGIGGRSRRGCGSVWWDAGAGDAPGSVDACLAAARALTPARAGGPAWPTLCGGAILVGPASASADVAWRAGLDAMKNVRASQGVDPQILTRLGRPSLTDWKQQDYIPAAARRAFRSPRAALGLPIRFQGTTSFTLTAANTNRFPSPVHFKVIRLGEGNFHPVYTVIRTPMPGQLSANSTNGTLDPKGLDTFIHMAARLQGWVHHAL